MPNSIRFFTIWKGINTIVVAIKISNNCLVKDFLDNLTQQEQKKVDMLFALFDYKNREFTNTQKVKKLKFACNGCFELKPSGQMRLSFIYLKQINNYKCICLLDGFKKKQNKWPKNKIKKTEHLCKTVKQYEHDNILK